jgi:hypothetical protein
MGPSHKAAVRFGSRSHSLLGAPEKWGRKSRKFGYVLLELGFINWACWRRPGAASSAEQQRLEVHRTTPRVGSGRRDAAVVEEHRRRVGLEDRVARRLRVPPAAGRIRRDDDQERFARPRRRHPLDEAQGYAALIELQPDTYTVESIASRMGRGASSSGEANNRGSTEVLKRGWGKQQEVLRRMNRSGYRPEKWRGAES